MNILFLDLASRKPVVALVTEKGVLGMIQRDEKILEHELLLLIEHILKNSHLSYGDLTHVAGVTGPGGFTSVRLGVATANALAYALSIPIAGLSPSELQSPLQDTLPKLLSKLSYGSLPIIPEYGNRPFITLKKNQLTSNEKRTNAAA